MIVGRNSPRVLLCLGWTKS